MTKPKEYIAYMYENYVDIKKVSDKIDEYLQLNKQIMPVDYGYKQLNKEIIKEKKQPAISSGLIKIKAFKTARAFYFYNPELFFNNKLMKLENNIYVNYRPSNILERIPQTEEIVFDCEDVFENTKKKIDKFLEENNNQPKTYEIEIRTERTQEVQYVIDYINRQFKEKEYNLSITIKRQNN